MTSCDLLILGGGPAGFAAAITAAQAGLSTILVEKEHLGGTCLNWGCIPTKLFLGVTSPLAELHAQNRLKIASGQVAIDLPALQKRKASLVQASHKGMDTALKNAKVTLIHGQGRLTSPQTAEITSTQGQTSVSFKHLIIATGSRPMVLPGLEPDGQTVLDSTQLLDLNYAPKSLAIIGAGAIGLEMGQIFHRLGAAITLIDLAPVVAPQEDEDVSKTLASALKRQGWALHLGTKVASVTRGQNRVELTLDSGQVINAEKVLVAVGRRPNSQELGLEQAGLTLSGPGWVNTDDYLKASPTAYAVGDVNGRMLLAHAAEDQARYAVHHLLRKIDRPYFPCVVPSCIYGDPETMRTGASVTDLLKLGCPVQISKFMLAANPISQSHGSSLGLVKVIWSQGRVAGITAVGHGVSHLVTLAEIMVKQAWSRDQVHDIVFAHPTLDEARRPDRPRAVVGDVGGRQGRRVRGAAAEERRGRQGRRRAVLHAAPADQGDGRRDAAGAGRDDLRPGLRHRAASCSLLTTTSRTQATISSTSRRSGG